MTRPENPDKREVTLNPRSFELMQRGSEQLFDKELSNLNFEEASLLVGGIVMAITESSRGHVVKDNRIIVDAESDGHEAFAGYGRQVAQEIAPKIDDERELVINVVGDKTIWDSIRRREPKIEHTFYFRNEPPQYA